MPRKNVNYYYLEMNSPDQLRPSRSPHADFAIAQAKIPSPEFSRFLYDTVGRSWNWIDRLIWRRDEWERYVRRPELETWVAYLGGTPCGYVELERQARGNVEIAYFGLIPQFIGQKLGGHLLTFAIERAWAMGAARVWVHTCSMDHPAALANYQARGMRIYKEHTSPKDLPDEIPPLWPETK